jgi:flagella basal body P-ring formation protein FlgA
MIKILIFLMIFGTITADLFACQIIFYKKTFYLGDKNSLLTSDLIEKTSCPEDIQKKAIEIVLGSNGPLRSGYLVKAMEPPTLEILPEKFEILPLISFINLPQDWMWDNLTALNGNKAFHGESASINCPSCSSLGKKALEIRIDQKTVWANGDLKILIPILISKTVIPSTQETLSPDEFEVVKISVSNPNDYFTNIDEIKYYKLNLDINERTPLKKSNLRKKDLIKAGSPAILKLVSGGISIKSFGIPMSSGKIGEIIKVKNQKNNTVLYGKVIGENTLSVEL